MNTSNIPVTQPMMKRNGPAGSWRSRTARLLSVCALAACAASAFAQYGQYPQYGPNALPPQPPPQSRYWQAYHEDSLPNYAARWGFHAGEIDGQRDRETGHSFRPTHDDGYKHVPSSNGIPVPRGDFKSIYREAYFHGYSQGYGRELFLIRATRTWKSP